MGGFDSKEINPLDIDLSSAEKSLGTYTLLIFFNYCSSLTIGADIQAQCDSSSTFSDQGSETLSVFDPNYDSNSMLGVSAASCYFHCIKHLPPSDFVRGRLSLS